MTWQSLRDRAVSLTAQVRSRVRFAAIGRGLVAAGSLGLLGVAAEAAFRVRIDPAEARMPSGLYTRPVGWGAQGANREPIPIGLVADDLAETRIPVSLDQLPEHVTAAVLAVEDQHFFEHHGFDVRRLGGALLANLRTRSISQGGSTITQQLAKNLFLSADRTPLRKLREAAMASVLEHQYDKRTILEAYLNEIYLGQDGGRAIQGIGAAARFYFGKSANRLTLADAALLAGMIHAPNRYAPQRHAEAARERRNLVLRLMAEQHRVATRLAERAATTRIGTRVTPTRTVDARYFRDYVLAGRSGRLPARGAALYTTLDAGLQRAAETAVTEGLRRMASKEIQAAIVAIDPRSGEVLAMVGGRDYGGTQFNRATDARRQPGSAFKPIVALAALHRDGSGQPSFTLASVVEDEPLSVTTPAGRWQPTNYDRTFRGEVTFREALEQSLNVPFARVGLAVGPERIVATARRLGIESPLAAVPSLALGSSEVTLLELVRAYGVFATGGDLARTTAVIGRAALGSDRPLAEPPRLDRVAEPAETYLVTSALEGVVTRGTARSLDPDGRLGPIAGKTGTSNDWRDAWFVAYNPTIVVGVWVGYDDGRSLRMSGATAAVPIAARFLGLALDDAEAEPFRVPDGVEVARVGGGSSWFWDCGGEEVFLEGTAPDSGCGREMPVWDDWSELRGRLRAHFDRGDDLDDDSALSPRRRSRTDRDRTVEIRAGRLLARIVGELLEQQPELKERLEDLRARIRQ